MRDTEVSRPAAVGILPATIDVIQVFVVLEVSSVNSELVEGIEHAFHGEGARPRIGTVAFEDEHAVVYGGAGERTHGVLERWW